MLFGSLSSGSYTITNALLFEDGDTAYLSRTPSGAGNRKIWTLSFWLKRANLGAAAGEMRIFGGNANASHLYITDGDLLHWDLANDGASLNSGRLETTAVLRDTTAWYNIVCSLDTRTEVTAANRMRMWINGSEVSSFGARSNPGDDYATNAINDTTLHTIGYRHDDQGSPGMEFDGYLAEIIFLDGTAVTDASKFGKLNSKGIWVPITPNHTFGTNGFHLNFSNANLIGQTANSGSFSENLRTLGTNLGSIGTDAGHPNQAAAFNGTTIVAEASCARDNNATTGATIGKDWGSGNTNTITAFQVFGPTDDGFIDNTKAATIKLQGSTDNFSSSVVDLHTTASIADAGKSIHSVTSGITTSTAYRYHRIIMFATDGSSNAAKVAEVEFYRAGSLSLNNWSTNNLVAADQVEDSPTNDADNNIGNYPTWNILDRNYNGSTTEGNLIASVSVSVPRWVRSTIPVVGGSDIYYWEMKVTTLSGSGQISLVTQEGTALDALEGSNTNYLTWQNSGVVAYNGSTIVTTTAGWAVNNVIGVLLDSTNGRLYFSVNDDWEDGSGGSASSATVLSEITGGTGTTYAIPTFVGSVITGNNWFPAYQNPHSGSDVVEINFGQKAFVETIPTNAKRLMTANLPSLSVSSPATGTFVGNSNADGPFVYLGYKPDTSGTSTITEAGGSASTITWGTHARAHSNGFKIIASADDYNKSATNAYSIAIITSSQFADNNRAG